MADPAPILIVSVAAVGALGAGGTALRYPRISFGILFLLASFSRATLETPLGTMRPEMPAVAVVATILLLSGRFRRLLGLPRNLVVMALAFGTYLIVLGISSALLAPDTGQSLRMVAWLATSMLSGVVAFILIRPRPETAIEPLAFGGALMGAIGIVVAVLFLVLGPEFTHGIQEGNAAQPRVYAFGWETNLYASFLGMCALFAVEVARGPRKRAGLAMLALILVGFSLGLTRGAYVGLAFGAAAYAAARLVAERRPGDLPRFVASAVGMLVVGLVAMDLLLPNALERQARAGPAGPVATAIVPRPSVPNVPGATGNPPAGPSGLPATTPLPTPSPAPSLAIGGDTIAYRLERVPIALMDVPNSPLIGFGAVSFGQRHPERGAGPRADHIAILAVAVLYESGIGGVVALTVGFWLLLWSLWRSVKGSAAEGNWRTVGVGAAFIGSVVSVLVAYQGNNALHLAINWIVVGAAAALISGTMPGRLPATLAGQRGVDAAARSTSATSPPARSQE